MSFAPRSGVVLLIPIKGIEHLAVMLTDLADLKAGGARKSLFVNLSSVRSSKNADQTCILHPGDHPFIRQASFVFYARAFIKVESDIIRNVRNGKWLPQEEFTPAIFSRICTGLERSPNTGPAIRRFYNLAKRRGAGP